MKNKFIGVKPAMVDPIRHPKVIVPLETEFKSSYKNQLDKMQIDMTKAMVDMLIKK